jgi:uncharacterized membrane protein YphA (DoxX/SURF4 family)
MKILTTVIYHLSRLVLALVFIYAGFIKADDPVAFAGQVANYQILPYAWNYLVAATLPYLELLCGLLLLLNQRVRPAVLVLFVLNIIFMLLLGYTIARGLDIDCGCFNPNATTKTTPLMALWRDAGLLVPMVATWVLRHRQLPAKGDSASD